MKARPFWTPAATLVLASALLILFSACGSDAETDPPQSSSTTTPTTAPPVACSTPPQADRPTRSTARETIETFLSVFNRRRDLARGWLAPESTLEIMSGLEPVSHLELVDLDDHY